MGIDLTGATPFWRAAFAEDLAAMKLLTSLGSTLECLHTHFLDTGDFCEGAGVNDPWATAEEEEDGGPEEP